jgi:hypothetical protein
MPLQQNGTFYPMHKDYYSSTNNKTLLIMSSPILASQAVSSQKEIFLIPQYILEDHMGAIGVPPQVFYYIPS